MSNLAAYLALEGAVEAIHDAMDVLWQQLTDAEKADLDARP